MGSPRSSAFLGGRLGGRAAEDGVGDELRADCDCLLSLPVGLEERGGGDGLRRLKRQMINAETHQD